MKSTLTFYPKTLVKGFIVQALGLLHQLGHLLKMKLIRNLSFTNLLFCVIYKLEQ